MLLYFTLTIATSLVALISDLTRRQRVVTSHVGSRIGPRWGLSDIVILSALVSLPGFRYFVGTDFYIYWSIFQSLEITDWSGSIQRSPHEIGYTAFSLAVKSVWPEPQAIVWATSVAAVVPMYIGLVRLSKNRAFSLYLYLSLGFYFTGFNQIRQSIALGLSVLAFSYFRQSRVKYFLLMALAASFHVSAIVVPLVQFLTVRWRASPGRLALIAITVTALSLAFTLLSDVVGLLNDRYVGYVDAAETAGIGTLALGGIRVAAVLLGSRASRLVETEGVTGQRFFNPNAIDRYTIYVACGAGLILLGYVSVPAARLEQYFSVYMIFLLPLVFATTRLPRTMIWLTVSILLPFLYVYLITFNGLLPYQTQAGLMVGL